MYTDDARSICTDTLGSGFSRAAVSGSAARPFVVSPPTQTATGGPPTPIGGWTSRGHSRLCGPTAASTRGAPRHRRSRSVTATGPALHASDPERAYEAHVD